MLNTTCHCRGQRSLLFVSWCLNKVGYEIFLYLPFNMHCCWVFDCCRNQSAPLIVVLLPFFGGWSEVIPNDRGSCCLNLNERQPVPFSKRRHSGFMLPTWSSTRSPWWKAADGNVAWWQKRCEDWPQWRAAGSPGSSQPPQSTLSSPSLTWQHRGSSGVKGEECDKGTYMDGKRPWKSLKKKKNPNNNAS